MFSGYIESICLRLRYQWRIQKLIKGGCSDFQETIQQQRHIGGMPPQNFNTNKHQIVRFRGILAVKRRYEILAEMPDLTFHRLT